MKRNEQLRTKNYTLVFTNLMSLVLFHAQFGLNQKLLLVKNLTAERTLSYRHIRSANISHMMLKALGIDFEYLEPREILNFVGNNPSNYIYELSILREFDYLSIKKRKQKLRLKGVVSTGADNLFILIGIHELQLDIRFIKEWFMWKKFAYEFSIKSIYFPSFGSSQTFSKGKFIFVRQDLLSKHMIGILNSDVLELNLQQIKKIDIVINIDSLDYTNMIPNLKVKIKELQFSGNNSPLLLVKPHPNLEFDLADLNDFEDLIGLKTANSILKLDLDKLIGIPLEFLLLSKKIFYIGPWTSALNNMRKNKFLIISTSENESIIDRGYFQYKKMLYASWV